LVTPSYSYNSNSPWDLSGISIRNKSGDLIHYDDLPLEDKHPGGYWDIDKEKYYYNFESYFIGKVYPGHSSGICISEYSLLDFTTQFKGVPSGSRPHLRLWNHTWKNLIRYLNTNELLSTEIEKSINWKKIENFRDKYQVFCTNNRKDNSDKTIKDIEHYNLDEQSEVNKGLSIEEAKEGLSIKFDIPQENIEILIKG